MRLLEVGTDFRDGLVVLRASVDRPGSCFEVSFSFPEENADDLSVSGDPFVGPLLVPALLSGESLEFQVPVSPRLARGARRIMEVFAQWFPGVHHISLSFPHLREDAEAVPGGGVGAFVSGGVDSWHSILRERKRLTHLLHVHGTSSRLGDPTRRDAFAGNEARCRAIGASLGLPVVIGSTNLRSVFDLDWGLHYNGSALAGAILAVSGLHKEFLFPSSYSYAGLHPWGSHPLIDEAYSTERVEIEHHGCGMSRAEKVEWIARNHPEALRLMNVCVGDTAGQENCGRCWKCVRTMISLEITGTLRTAGSFPSRLPADLEEFILRDSIQFVEENLALARRVAPESRITLTLRRCLERRKRKEALRVLAELTPGVRRVLAARRERIERRRRLLARA